MVQREIVALREGCKDFDANYRPQFGQFFSRFFNYKFCFSLCPRHQAPFQEVLRRGEWHPKHDTRLRGRFQICPCGLPRVFHAIALCTQGQLILFTNFLNLTTIDYFRVWGSPWNTTFCWMKLVARRTKLKVGWVNENYILLLFLLFRLSQFALLQSPNRQLCCEHAGARFPGR